MLRRLVLLLTLLALPLAACSDDEPADDEASSSASASAAEVDDDDRASDGGDEEADAEEEAPAPDPVTGMTESEPLDPAAARRAGNPEVYDRIATTTDCGSLARSLAAHERNAANRRAGGDEERASILDAYAEATRERMAELGCPETGGGTTTTGAPGV